MILNAARAAFLPETEKARLVSWFEMALQKSLAGIPLSRPLSLNASS
jgi:hypothetical protein